MEKRGGVLAQAWACSPAEPNEPIYGHAILLRLVATTNRTFISAGTNPNGKWNEGGGVDGSYFTTMMPRIMAKWPGKVQTNW